MIQIMMFPESLKAEYSDETRIVSEIPSRVNWKNQIYIFEKDLILINYSAVSHFSVTKMIKIYITQTKYRVVLAQAQYIFLYLVFL